MHQRTKYSLSFSANQRLSILSQLHRFFKVTPYEDFDLHRCNWERIERTGMIGDPWNSQPA
ncbi:MAG: hypothetical protein N3E41_08545, partial [Thermofilaceae archaeon]|nr:hypothetical protein [Thermofilaceae archaeon]